MLTTLIAKYVTTLASSTDMTRMMRVVTTVLSAQRFFSSLLIGFNLVRFAMVFFMFFADFLLFED